MPGSIINELLAGGLANAITSTIVHPMDVTKTRMQAQVEQKDGLLTTARTLVRQGGVLSFWRLGYQASMIREMVSSGLRTGLYTSVRNAINQHLPEGLINKICAAMVTGCIGAVLANPIDVCKVKLMVDGGKYTSLYRTVQLIIQEEGYIGFSKGLLASTLRGSFIAAGELATYDHSKHTIQRYFKLEGGDIRTHICASLITGIVATTVAAPFDLIKTRMMRNEDRAPPSILQLVRQSVKKEGLSVLMRGWWPAYMRLGPHAIICFPILEQLRKGLGEDYI